LGKNERKSSNLKINIMSLKPQSIRKNVRVIWNGEPISKQEIIDMSVYWSEIQINFFKKMLKQGGTFKINGNQFKTIIDAPILTSKGEKDGGVIQSPSPDTRF
jgi:hypothetical protein|tara:strand:- start:39 stop:347 length:309 start_codon:yes stop_codon:yes gene_type:complete